MSDIVLQIQKQLNISSDQNFLLTAGEKIAEDYRPIILRLLNKNCRLLSIKCDELLIRSWQEETSQELKKALQSYHAHQHYSSERSLHAYLLASLRNFTKQRFWSQSGKKKYCVFICPACRFLEGQKNPLIFENRLWRCKVCCQKPKTSIGLNNLYSAFALHSSAGFLCPDCNNFIPRNLEKNGYLSCPFPDCCFSGSVAFLSRTTHPVMVMFRADNQSIDYEKGKENKNNSASDKILLDINSSFSEDSFLLKDISEKEFSLLQETIQSAMCFTERQNLPATKAQKILFYRAFWDLTEEHPEEMISYLLHNKTNFDFPLQARIFQKFLTHLENFLPYSFANSKGEKIEIDSLFNPKLLLFEGESSFSGFVQKDHSLQNLTSERYLSQNLKDYGPYFLGKIVELKTEDGRNLLPMMRNNSFARIQFSDLVAPGTKVFVRHYRLIPHYTMGILIHLQKIRKHLGEVLARKKKNWK